MRSYGKHNQDLQKSVERLLKGGSYRDLSTICVIPTPTGMLNTKVATAIWSLMTPMNQKFTKFCIEGKEVGQGYNDVVAMILQNPELSKWKYLLTVEWDNLPPPDGLLKLYESIEMYDVVGGLYWTKGEGGQPMIYGNPAEMPKDFRPQVPRVGEVQECNGLGMGFTLFRISMFKKLASLGHWPLFKTLQEFVPGQGAALGTQDLFFFSLAGREGYRFASDNRVLVGHLDQQSGEVW